MSIASEPYAFGRRAPAQQSYKPQVSSAQVDLMLLLMRSNVPNAEVLSAKGDRELAILAQRHGVDLPAHLAHLPTLPVERSPTEKAALVEDYQAQESGLIDDSAVKDRPPERARQIKKKNKLLPREKAALNQAYEAQEHTLIDESAAKDRPPERVRRVKKKSTEQQQQQAEQTGAPAPPISS